MGGRSLMLEVLPQANFRILVEGAGEGGRTAPFHDLHVVQEDGVVIFFLDVAVDVNLVPKKKKKKKTVNVFLGGNE